MADLKLQLSIVDTEKVQTMIELLHKYKDGLPRELMNSLDDLADCDACEYGVGSDLICGVPPYDVECYADNLKVNGVISVNIILKRLTVYPRSYLANKEPELNTAKTAFVESYKYPKNFIMKDKLGNKLLGWG